MTIDAVIFDWGGTLTPWHTIDHEALWRAVCRPHFDGDHQRWAAAAHAAETEAWELAASRQLSSTIFTVLQRAGIEPTEGLLASYRKEWAPHTFTDPAASEVLRYLRAKNIRTGVLSNTLWPGGWHDDVFSRDGVLHLIDGAVYSSEIEWAKPHRQAFISAMTAVGAADPARCVFVGDRPRDDIHGAKSLGMKAVLVPHSEVPPCGEAKPDAVISRLSDLPAVVESWSAG